MLNVSLTGRVSGYRKPCRTKNRVPRVWFAVGEHDIGTQGAGPNLFRHVTNGVGYPERIMKGHRIRMGCQVDSQGVFLIVVESSHILPAAVRIKGVGTAPVDTR